MSEPIAFVIEDDFNLAAAFGEALVEAGYRVEIIYDGRTAIDRLEASTPSAVVLDLHIPHIEGTEVLKYIQESEKYKDTRVIVATADDRLGDAMRDSADLVLIKPVGFRQLRDLAIRLRP